MTKQYISDKIIIGFHIKPFLIIFGGMVHRLFTKTNIIFIIISSLLSFEGGLTALFIFTKTVKSDKI